MTFTYSQDVQDLLLWQFVQFYVIVIVENLEPVPTELMLLSKIILLSMILLDWIGQCTQRV